MGSERHVKTDVHVQCSVSVKLNSPEGDAESGE